MGAAKQQMIEDRDNELKMIHSVYGDCARCSNAVDVDWEGVIDLEKEGPSEPLDTGSYMCGYCQHMLEKLRDE